MIRGGSVGDGLRSILQWSISISASDIDDLNGLMGMHGFRRNPVALVAAVILPGPHEYSLSQKS